MADLCCGCILESDYGTSTVTGDGSPENPYQLNQIDPTFQRPVVRVRRPDGAQSIPNNTPTAVSFTVEDFDTHSMWSLGVPTRIIIPIEGLYLFGFCFEWAAAANQVREIFFRVNGTTEIERQSQIKGDAVTGPYDMTYQWFFSAGDYLEVIAFQTSGGALNLGTSTLAQFWCMFMGKKV